MSSKRVLLTPEEKAIFAKALYEVKKSRPMLQWSDCFKEARKVLPKNRQAYGGKGHPSEVPGLPDMLKSLEKNFGLMITPSAKPVTKKDQPKKSALAKVQTREKPKPPAQARKVNLNDDEKMFFAKTFLAARKANPEAGNANAIRFANSQMPEHRRIGAKIDSLAQLPWLKILLDKLESQSETSQPEKRKLLDKKERVSFAKAIYERRKANPDESWKGTFQEINKTLSFDKRFPDSLNHPGQIAWIRPLLEKLEKDDKARLVIDHRHTNAVPAASAPAPEIPNVTVIPEGKGGKDKSGSRNMLKADEKMLFAEAAYRARITNLGWSWNQCLIEANKSLPEYRRFGKLPHSPSQMPWLPPILEEISKRSATSQDKIVPEPEGGYEIIPEQPAAPAPAPAIDMQAVIANAIAVAVQEQVKALMGGNLTGAVASAMAPVINSAKPAEKKPDMRKKVIVVGLLPVQTNEVQKDFGSFYDLRFFHSNTPIPQIRESMKNVDFAILMTRFVSHSMATAMRTHPGFIFCDGNSTALKMKLKEKLSS